MSSIFVLSHSIYKRPAALIESYQPWRGGSWLGGFALTGERRSLG
jgi:hypothetical protein